MITKTIAAAAIVAGVTAGAAGTALADHGHFVVREARDGTTLCRYIADGQTSKTADEPGGHAFHDQVHSGQPGGDDHGNDFDKEGREDDWIDDEGVSQEGRCDIMEEPGR